MPSKLSSREARLRRHQRIRKRVSGTGARPRLAVFRSMKHIYAQVIDDEQGHTLAAASTLDSELAGAAADGNKTAQAKAVGALIARRARDKGILQVVFDRGGYVYHGRVRALAEAAREAGLEF